MSSFAVVVVAYRSRADITKCLDSLLAPRQPLMAGVALVVNPPDDGTAEFVTENYPEVKLLLPQQNLGFAYGNNLGANQFPDADFYFFLNPDAALPPQVFHTLDSFFTAHPQAGISGFVSYSPDGSTQLCARDFPTIGSLLTLRSMPLARLLGHDAEAVALDRLLRLTTPSQIDWVAGLSMCIRGALFRQLHGFDPGYFVFAEDIDICWQAHSIGYETWILPQVRVWHRWGGSVGKPTLRKSLMHLSALWRFLRFRYGITGWLERILFTFFWLFDLLSILYSIAHPRRFISLRNTSSV